jgi:hypothetical protein
MPPSNKTPWENLSLSGEFEIDSICKQPSTRQSQVVLDNPLGPSNRHLYPYPSPSSYFSIVFDGIAYLLPHTALHKFVFVTFTPDFFGQDPHVVD